MFLALICLALISCAKPSYKKNEIIKGAEKSAESSIFDIPRNQKLSPDQQITSAILAAPIEGRNEAAVYGYSEGGDFMLLREGFNDFICIADDPNKD